jgi:hypothetical protein
MPISEPMPHGRIWPMPATHPAVGRVGSGLQRLHRVLLTSECRRERVDDQRDDEDADKPEGVHQDELGQRRTHADLVRAHEWHRDADQRAPQEHRDRSDGRQDQDVFRVEAGRRFRLRRNHRPFRFWRQQDVLRAPDQVAHGEFLPAREHYIQWLFCGANAV